MLERKEDVIIEKLKRLVLTTHGLEPTDKLSCVLLSEDIFLKTKNYISKSTIEVLYGTGELTKLTTPFVLSSLAQYCGYPNWHSYSDKAKET